MTPAAAALPGPLPQPDVRPVTDTVYELHADYRYTWALGGTENRLTIWRGFRYDGASVPRLVWTVSGMRPDGLIRAAALVHDWLYVHGGLLPTGSHQARHEGEEEWLDLLGRWSRRDADRLFARLMREAGVSPIRRRAAYLAARLFGLGAWKD